jgi:hypothetical protein
MTYKVINKATNKLKTTFHVLDATGDIVGSINVAPSQEGDLLKHWNGQANVVALAEKNQPAALRPRPIGKFSPAFVLRG